MIARRKAWRRFGASLAGVALVLQLALASWGAALGFAAAPANEFGEHALCLAGSRAPPDQPGGQVPANPAHDHDAFCCFWHPLPALQPIAAATPVPVVYATVSLALADAGSVFGLPHRPANARAPPDLT